MIHINIILLLLYNKIQAKFIVNIKFFFFLIILIYWLFAIRMNNMKYIICKIMNIFFLNIPKTEVVNLFVRKMMTVINIYLIHVVYFFNFKSLNFFFKYFTNILK